MKDKIIIGLTGKYCSGKNHIGKIIESRGIPVLDVDTLGHRAIETEKDIILARFGDDILGDDGQINRKILGARVFNHPDELAALEEIIHPAANRETLAWIDRCVEKACVINAALLHRSAVFELLRGVIIVKAPLPIRLLRAKKRDRIPWTAIIKRMNSQKNFHSQYFGESTDIHIVENSVFYKPENRIDEILSLFGAI